MKLGLLKKIWRGKINIVAVAVVVVVVKVVVV